MVAACPKISVQMKKLILSSNVIISNKNGENKTVEKSVFINTNNSNSDTESSTNGWSENVEASFSWLTGFSASVSITHTSSTESSTNVTHEKGSSNSSSESFGTTLTKTLSLNESDAAFINDHLRYKNIGTASIYNLRSTINFVLDKKEQEKIKFDTIATIVAKKIQWQTQFYLMRAIQKKI